MKYFTILLTALLALCGCAHRINPRAARVHIGITDIDIDIDQGVNVTRATAVEWVRRAAVAVADYYGKFPSEYLHITIHGGGTEAISDGVTHGNDRIEVRVSPGVTMADLNHDWILTHEMFHLGFPTLDRQYLWMNEGLSDYLEPIARARTGQLSAEDVWREFYEGFPQGLTTAKDHGLNNIHTRESIYWGGNIYWLLVDVRIRDVTGNRHSLDDGLRAILATGGDGAVTWTVDQVFANGDVATGTTIMKRVYDEMGPQYTELKLPDLWHKLGVKYDMGTVTFDDTAPWADIRRSITARRP